MTEKRSTLILALIFFVLLLLTFFGYIVYPTRKITATLSNSLMRADTKKQIASIVLTSDSARFPIRLIQKDTRWWLSLGNQLYPAREEKIHSFINELIRRRTILNTHASNGHAYGIDNTDSIRVRIIDAGERILSDLYFGHNNATGTQIAVRSGTDIHVLLVEDTLSSYLDMKTAFWVDLTIFQTISKTANIQRIRYIDGNRTKEYRAGQDKEIGQFEQILNSLTCIDITNIPIAAQEQIELELGDTSVVHLKLAPLNENEYIITDSRTGAAYILSKWSKERIEKTFSK